MRFDAAIVGEPTSRAKLGDTVKIGRRGSLSGTLRVTGRQGHVAYPHLADNPVPKLVRLLDRLISLRLDEGSADFQPSNLEVTSVDVGNPAFNVIPAEATARFNVRFNDRWSAASLLDFLRAELDAAAGGATYDADRDASSESFLTRSDALIAPLAAAIRDVTGVDAGAVDRRRHVGRALLQGRLPGGRVRPGRRHHAPGRRARAGRRPPGADADLSRLPRPPLRRRGAGLMLDREEIVRSLTGAWELFLDRPGAMRHFDVSVDGFWRSFAAVLLVVPSYAFAVLADRQMAAAMDPSAPVQGDVAFIAKASSASASTGSRCR